MILSECSSWEIGTQTEALLEYDWPALAVFGAQSLPPANIPPSFGASNVVAIVSRIVNSRAKGQLQFFQETTVGDPASAYCGDHIIKRHGRELITTSCSPRYWSG